MIQGNESILTCCYNAVIQREVKINFSEVLIVMRGLNE